MATDAAPETNQQQTERPRTLSEELENLQSTFAERSVRLEEVIAVLRGRAYILLLILLALPFSTPIPLPGLSTPFGLVIGLIALRLALGQKPWLPKKLLQTQLPAGFFAKLISFTKRIVHSFEKLLRPRALFITESEVLKRIHALTILISACVLLLPLPIPFTNMFPAWTVLLVAGGLLERDGIFVIAGYIMLIIGAAYFFLLGHTMQQFMEAVRHYFFS